MKYFFTIACAVLAADTILAAERTVIAVRPEKIQQEFQGMGCGAIFYEAHITSIGMHGNTNLQVQLYDDMFAKVKTDVLQLMIRPDHEPVNDNDDPYKPEFDEKNFKYCEHDLQIATAAKKRNPAIKLYAVLYTPPAWMKTNNDPGGGGQAKGTLKDGLELEAGEYIWAFLDYMRRHGQTIDFLSISNESDWPHTQPGYFMTTEKYVDVFGKIAAYLDEMSRRHPETPKPKLVAPNNLSAVDCAAKILLPLLEKCGPLVDVVGCHDYDRRGHRWKAVSEKSDGRPVWQTENCFNGHDGSAKLINSATEQWLAMSEAFNEGVNVWFAYDWVYPPREGGEALIHLNWEKDYKLTKIYHGFRQWCAPLVPGMHIVETELSGPCASGIAKPGVKASAFLSADGKRLVVHAAAVQESSAVIALQISGDFANATLHRWRTSKMEDFADLGTSEIHDGLFTDELPSRGMTTYEIERVSKNSAPGAGP